MPRGRYGAYTKHEKPSHCPRGHELFEENKLNSSCRACQGAFNWARRNSLFNDDPKTIAKANELYAKYCQQAGKDT